MCENSKCGHSAGLTFLMIADSTSSDDIQFGEWDQQGVTGHPLMTALDLDC